MANTGWKLPTVATSDKNLGNTGWNSPSNVLLQDGVSSTYSGAKFNGNDPEDGPSLKVSGFGFTLPAAAIITGIEAKIYGNGSHAGESAYLFLEGSPRVIPYGIEKKDYWARTSSPYIFGSEFDLWGTYDLTPDLVNASNFGWVYMIYDSAAPLSAAIDSMQMKIYYEVPLAAGMMGAGF